MTLTVILQIYREGIESQNLARVLTCLHTLTDSCEKVLRFQEALVFMVAKYDEDSREIQEIPEIRLYFSRLVAEWPHFFWYLVRGFGNIALLMALLCEIKVIRSDDQVGSAFQNGGNYQPHGW